MDRIRITDETSEIWLVCWLNRKQTIETLRTFLQYRKGYQKEIDLGEIGLSDDIEKASGWLILLGIRAMSMDANDLVPSTKPFPIELTEDIFISGEEVIFEVNLSQSKLSYILPQQIIVDQNQPLTELQTMIGGMT